MYDPANRTAVLDQGDIDGEFAVLLDKLMRAVERVDEQNRPPLISGE